MMVIDGVEVLEVREAAEYVRRTPETVRRWVWSGRLPALKRGNRLLLRRTDLDALTTGGSEPLSLAEWARLLPRDDGAAGSGTAADLVVADRERRAGR